MTADILITKSPTLFVIFFMLITLSYYNMYFFIISQYKLENNNKISIREEIIDPFYFFFPFL